MFPVLSGMGAHSGGDELDVLEGGHMGDYGESAFYPSDLLAEYKSMWARAENVVVQVSMNKYRCVIYGGGTKGAKMENPA